MHAEAHRVLCENTNEDDAVVIKNLVKVMQVEIELSCLYGIYVKLLYVY